MEKTTTTLADVTTIFRDVFDDETIELTDETTANDIEEWDSLAHIQLIVAIQQKFKVNFSSIEIGNLKNVGDIVASIENKQ